MAMAKGVLEGHVEHRLNLSPSNAPRKRQRTANSSSDPLDGGSSLAKHILVEKEAHSALAEAGYYLVVANDTYLLSVPHYYLKQVCDAARFHDRVRVSRYTRMPLMSPTTTTRSDMDCRNKRKHPEADELAKSTCTALLEIHENGLELLSTPNSNRPKHMPKEDDFLTLEQVFAEEARKAKEEAEAERDKQEIVPADTDKKKKSRKRQCRSSNRYSFKGTVDSISPVIFVDEPFALMELYDDETTTGAHHPQQNSPPYSCVVVFQGIASLVCHGGIVPGDRLCLAHCKRQRWKIPDVITRHKAWHLRRRVPSHVFVLQDPQHVIWQDASSSPVIPQSISTPVPLVSLRGKVVSRKWASRGTSPSSESCSRQPSFMIHAIEIEPLQRCNVEGATNDTPAARHILFLTYYPMSPSLVLSLRSGAMVSAVNIHCIGSSFGDYQTDRNDQKNNNSIPPRRHYYGACLRSTVSILRMPPPPSDAPISSISAAMSQAKDQVLEGVPSKFFPSRPYALLSVQVSYLEYACRKEVYRWYYAKDNFQKSQESELPACDALCKLWWSHRPGVNYGTRSSKTRNPYLEFFDHACDDSETKPPGDASTQSSSPQRQPMEGCHCARTQSIYYYDDKQHALLPEWIPLHELQDNGIQIMQDRLTKALKTQPEADNVPIGKPHIGWTASIDLTASAFLGHGNGEEGRDFPALYTGGHVVESDYSDVASSQGTRSTESSLVSASLANDRCVLPANKITNAPAQGAMSSPSCHGDAASFAFGELDGVVVSCFCVKTVSGAVTGNFPAVDSIKCGDNLHSGASDMNDSNGPRYSREWRHLPRHDHLTGHPLNASARSSLRGACSLWEIGELLFVLSVHLRFKTLVPVPPAISKSTKSCGDSSQATTKISNNSGGGTVLTNNFTVQQCLDPEASTTFQAEQKDKINVIGALTRQRLRLSKIANSRYRGCVLTLNHIPVNLAQGYDNRAISTLQCLEVKTEIHYNDLDRKRKYLKEQFAKLKIFAGVDSGGDATNLVLAWWKLADRAGSCALASCGWDDFLRVPPKGSSRCYAVIVQLPGTAAQKTEARGYQRFSCRLSEVQARLLRIECDQDLDPRMRKSRPVQERLNTVAPSTLFDCQGGYKFLPGKLDRRPLRRIQQVDVAYLTNERRKSRFSLVLGERMMLPPTALSGIPECDLEFLIRCVCLDLQRQANSSLPKQTYMAPSLVRKVSRARLLGISFCQAQATCTRCFQALRQQNPKEKQIDRRSRPKQRTQKGWEENQKQPSFWHCPLPISGTTRDETASEAGKPSPRSLPQSARDKSTLCCPNGCDVGAFAEVKWECSGTLDDGTAQAKLYAEREAAVMLLGMNQETVDWIEEGAWMHPSGCIVFSRTVPPPSHLTKAVEAANFQFAAQEKDRQQCRRRLGSQGRPGPNTAANTPCGIEKSNPSRILDMLEPVDRAFYLLYSHCRHSKEATREMDYLVRCKPLADKILHLNHTEIDVVAPGAREGTLSSHHSATYSLPPLKLILVDGCVPARCSSGAILVEETWDLLENLRRDL